MAIYGAFNEIDGFDIITGAFAASTYAGIAISGVNRAGVSGGGNGSTTATHTFSEDVESGWLHFLAVGGGRIAASGSSNFVTHELLTNVATNLVHLQSNCQSSNVLATLYVLGVSTGITVQMFALVTEFDVNFFIHPTDGFIRVYFNKSLVYSMSGNTTAGGTITAARAFRWTPCGNGTLGPTTSTISHIGHILITDAPTINARVHSLPLSAFGYVNDWSGTLSDVNGTGIGGASISADTADEEVLFTHPAMGTLNLGNVITGVGVGVRGFYTAGSAVDALRALCKVGGVEYEGDLSQMTEGARSRFLDFSVNPATGAVWTPAEVTAAQFGMVAE